MPEPIFPRDDAERRARARRKEQARRKRQRIEAARRCSQLRKAFERLVSFDTPVSIDLEKYRRLLAEEACRHGTGTPVSIDLEKYLRSLLGPDARLPPGSPTELPVSLVGPAPDYELADLPGNGSLYDDDSPLMLASPSDARWGQIADLALAVGNEINTNKLSADLDGLLDRGLEAYDADPASVWSLRTRVIMAYTETPRKDREWVRDCALAAHELLKIACKGDRAGLVEKLVRAHRCGLVGPDGIYDWLGWIGAQLVASLRECLTGQKTRGMSKRPLRPAGDASPTPAPEAASTLEFEPGAFCFRGHREPLTGKPLQVLEALAAAQNQTRTLAALQKTVWSQSSAGEEAIRSAVSDARIALRRAFTATGAKRPRGAARDWPIVPLDRGTGRLAWRLYMP